jgi:ribosome-associated protein
MQIVTVPTAIRLGQFLKFFDLAENGAMAKALLADKKVQVNGEVETRRGRQLTEGDVVTIDQGEVISYSLAHAAPEEPTPAPEIAKTDDLPEDAA